MCQQQFPIMDQINLAFWLKIQQIMEEMSWDPLHLRPSLFLLFGEICKSLTM